jgi:tetratricopeptide (TPR) repeat protein
MSAIPWAVTTGGVRLFAGALADELPELDLARVHTAVERAAARVMAMTIAPTTVLDDAATGEADLRRAEEACRARGDWENVVDLQLARVVAAQERAERAAILRELADDLEREMSDLDGALSARRDAFAEAPSHADIAPLLRLAAATGRWGELELAGLEAIIEPSEIDARTLNDLAAAWAQAGNAERAAHCHERALTLEPADERAHDALELHYRSERRWPALIDLLERRGALLEGPARAELLREIAVLHERELADGSGAFDAYRAADRLEPDRPEVLAALARLAAAHDVYDEALAAMIRLARLIDEPGHRADLHHRAAAIAWRHLDDGDAAHDLLARARDDAPDRVDVLETLAELHRDRGALAEAVLVLAEAARRAPPADRARLLGEAAALCGARGDHARAIAFYREVRAAAPTDLRAATALAALDDDQHSPHDLVAILDLVVAGTDDPARRSAILVRLAAAAARLGDVARARAALTEAVALDPDGIDARRALADLLLEQRDWTAARACIETILDEHEESLPPATCVDLHHRAARAAHTLGDDAGAGAHAATVLALDPDHRPTLLLRIDLDAGNPQALVADHLALAQRSTGEEAARHFAAIGDLYADHLANPAGAREMYREALAHRPGDHLLLTKSLGLVASDGDWSYSIDLLRRLIETETAAAVRARYCHVAAMILRDELGRPEEAADLLTRAIEDAPALFAASDDLEALLRAAATHDALVFFYYRRLEQLRSEEGRAGERLRLWDRLGELCVALGRLDDAVCAYEVGHSFHPDDLDRRARLADLYGAAGRRADAIAHHQAILAVDKRRAASYRSLRDLSRDTSADRKADACEHALAIVDGGPRSPLPRAVAALPTHALGADQWQRLSSLDVDPVLSALFAVAAPAFAAERARRFAPIPAIDHARIDGIPRPVAAQLRRVLTVLGMPRPPIYVDRTQAAAYRLTACVGDGILMPVLMVGQGALDERTDERALMFTLSRRLCDLRADRVARLLCPRAADLARIIRLAVAIGADTVDAHRHAARWLTTALHPLALDQLAALGRRIGERGLDPDQAALGWLEATERAADRVGLIVTGDLATCVDTLRREPAAGSGRDERVLELVWSSVTEEMFAVREHVEGWQDDPFD